MSLISLLADDEEWFNIPHVIRIALRSLSESTQHNTKIAAEAHQSATSFTKQLSTLEQRLRACEASNEVSSKFVLSHSAEIIAGGNETLKTINTKIVSLQNSLTDIKKHVSQQDHKLANGIKSVSDSLRTLEDRIRAHDVDVKDGFSDVKRRLADLESASAQQKHTSQQVDTFRDATVRVDAFIRDQSDRVNSLAQAVRNVETAQLKHSTTSEDWLRFNSAISELRTAVGSINTQVAHRNSDLDDRLKELRIRYEGLKHDQLNLQDEVFKAADLSRKASVANTQNERQFEELTDKVEKDIKKLFSKSEKNAKADMEKLSEYQRKLEKIEASSLQYGSTIDLLTSQFYGNSVSPESLKSRMDTLEKLLEGMREFHQQRLDAQSQEQSNRLAACEAKCHDSSVRMDSLTAVCIKQFDDIKAKLSIVKRDTSDIQESFIKFSRNGSVNSEEYKANVDQIRLELAEISQKVLKSNDLASTTSEDLGRFIEKVVKDRKDDLRYVDMLEARMSTAEVEIKQSASDLATLNVQVKAVSSSTIQASVDKALEEVKSDVHVQLKHWRDEITSDVNQLFDREFIQRLARHEESLILRTNNQNALSSSALSANLSVAVAEEVKREIESSFYTRNEIDSIMLSQMMTVVGRLNQKVDVSARNSGMPF